MLKGKKFLVTAGPTRESIDMVRFISNRSSGMMGIYIAEDLAANGAEVFFVCGPVNRKKRTKNVHRVNVESADEMFHYCLEIFPLCDGVIMAAAVADYTPTEFKPGKIKKNNGDSTYLLMLKKTKDILFELGKIRNEKQVIVGFSLEVENEIENATNKLLHKNMDFIVLNSLKDKGAGFDVKTNKITIINKNGEITQFPLKSKREVARDIVNYLTDYIAHF